MNTQTVVKNLESAINWICKDIKAKKGGAGAEKLDSLAELVNAYSRLIERDREIEKEHDTLEDYNTPQKLDRAIRWMVACQNR